MKQIFNNVSFAKISFGDKKVFEAHGDEKKVIRELKEYLKYKD